MNKITAFFFVVVLGTTAGAFAKEEKVNKGYTKQDGTRVDGYTKTV